MQTLNSNTDLVRHLQKLGVLRSPSIIQAFKTVDRKDFVLPEHENISYQNTPLPIGYGQTISQPYTVAFMLELLSVEKGNKILDIGSGSGWTTALLASIVGETGSVAGLEIIPELVVFGINNVNKYGYTNTKILQGKEYILGMPEDKFDRILVSASAETMPEKLLDRLENSGIMVIPIQNSIFRFSKVNGEINSEEYPGFVFVPLKLQIS